MLLIKNYEVDLWGWTEPNLKLTPQLINMVEYIKRNMFKNVQLVTSLGNNLTGRTQKGGTCTVIISNMVGQKSGAKRTKHD